jgi:glycosyltransferase involved in cell wall biosynthesis
MKVLHLLKTSTGATWALRQMRELVRAGVEVHAAMPDGELVEQYKAAGVHVHVLKLSIPLASPHHWPRVAGRMRRLVADVGPDLIHSHFVGTTLTMRLALGRSHAIPRIYQVPGPLHLEHAWTRRAELATAGPADFWVGSCRWTCDAYRANGVPEQRTFLAYYGTDIDRYVPQPPGTIRRLLPVRSDTRIIGMVAHIYAPKRWLGQRRGLKGHEDLIDAVAQLRNDGDDVLCVIVGGAWSGARAYEARVREYARDRAGSSVVFLGNRDDVPALYSDMDVAVHPSYSENVGGAVESLLLGIPTVATAVGGHPDLVRHGETGWLVPPRSPAPLVAAIRNALADPANARRLACKGQRLARSLFDVRTTSALIMDIYGRVLSGAGTEAKIEPWRR